MLETRCEHEKISFAHTDVLMLLSRQPFAKSHFCLAEKLKDFRKKHQVNETVGGLMAFVFLVRSFCFQNKVS